jgi:septin family protein
VTRLTTKPGEARLPGPRSPYANRALSFSEIVNYLEREYDNVLAEESRIKRNPRFKDNRVHVLLYFITPTGHGYVSRLQDVCGIKKMLD